MVDLFANSEDPDQTPHSAVSDLGLHCLPVQGCKIPLACSHLRVNFRAGQVRFSELFSLFLHF